MMPSRDAVTDYLTGLPGGEFADVLHAVLVNRPESKVESLGEQHLRLAYVERSVACESSESDPALEGWTIRLVAHADPVKYGPEWFRAGEPFVQQGECYACGLDLASHVKQAICPMCSGVVHLT